MTFEAALAEMKKGKWVKYGPQTTLYSIQEGIFSLKIQTYSVLGKQNYYVTKTLAPHEQSTLFVKHILSEEWEVVE